MEATHVSSPMMMTERAENKGHNDHEAIPQTLAVNNSVVS